MFFISILKDVLYVLTDRLHKSQFHLQTVVLRTMCHLIERGGASAPLWDPRADPGMESNQQYVRVYTAKLLSSAFQNLNTQQVQAFVVGFFDTTKTELTYKTHLRDFLISLRKFSGEDNKGLFTDEMEEKKEMAKQADLARRSAVPGMLNPNTEIDDDDL